MSTRIIIEKDGERYVANDLTVRFIDGGRSLCVENKIDYDFVSSCFTRLPPVVRTDNSDVIARIEDENKRLKNEIDNLHIERGRLQWRVSTYWSALEPIAAVSIFPPIGEDGLPHVADIMNCVDAVKASKNILNGGCVK